ncbi:MAG: 3-dehydroquinate synthase [Sphaerochaetaceae bacterium]
MKHIFDCNLQNATTKVYSSLSLTSILDHLFETNEKKLFIVDENTKQFIDERCDTVQIPPGEGAKHMETVCHIISEAKKRDFSRDDMFVAVGGGVICDITGFAASIYMRGASVAFIPTTLLAQVDASLGGKTGVDFENVKNFIGQFYPAQRLYLSPQPLLALSDKEYKNGLGEVLKHALLAQDDTLYTYLSNNADQILNRDKDILNDLILFSLEVKKSFIERDPKETEGIRDSLNLGHTFGHALESMGNLSMISHGEAVAWGVVAALRCSYDRNLCTKEFYQKYEQLFVQYGFSLHYDITDTDSYLDFLKKDKKRRKGEIRFVLMKDQGEPVITAVEGSRILPYII